MLFKRLPDPNDRRALQGFLWADETVVIHDKAENVAYGRHVAPLTLKATLKGVERYNVHGFFEDIGPGEYLAINDGQPYESVIDSDSAVESLCLFFPVGDVADARRSAIADDLALDDPHAEEISTELLAVKRTAGAELARLLAMVPRMRGEPAFQRHTHAVQLAAALLRDERTLQLSAQSSAARERPPPVG